MEIFITRFYHQHVIEPTFQLVDQCPKSILDLVITDDSHRIYNIDHGPPLGITNKGHMTLRWNYELKSLKSEKNGEIITDLAEISNILNDQFKSIFINDATESIPSMDAKTKVKCDPNKDTLFECEKIIEKLKKIDPSKTMGPDKVSDTVLKNCAESLSLAFSIIFKKSYESGEAPVLWKHANVTPIHKGGSKLSKKNYRPVSLTCLVCKIFESLLKDIMLHHLLTNNLISKSQHGFLPKKSCLTNLLETLDFITQALSNGFLIDIIYTDFAKAFDKVSHKKLIFHLKMFGFGDEKINWVKAFLTGRKQRVVLGEQSSK
ncbi:unnamed protein product [Brachionus calyciflorus]|uniref:Reverse transcriptase domain-containing protein n=1 Tax=Brachionus calyciflorus TaxID=104777 RepID=A0A814LGK9_9BILA|nr:unnamed protein product [Brachionus calyciflorus]